MYYLQILSIVVEQDLMMQHFEIKKTMIFVVDDEDRLYLYKNKNKNKLDEFNYAANRTNQKFSSLKYG
jgi:hypothetical protein